jgi:hypothetical protein
MARWLLTTRDVVVVEASSWETAMVAKLSRAIASTTSIGWRENKGRTVMVHQTTQRK